MASSKKTRGKQRKIAKREAAAKSLRFNDGPRGLFIEEGQQGKCAMMVEQGDKICNGSIEVYQKYFIGT